jgi:hypothetical protein
MVWFTPDTATPAVIVPAEAVEQVKAETTAVPSVEGLPAAMQRTELANARSPVSTWALLIEKAKVRELVSLTALLQ